MSEELYKHTTILDMLKASNAIRNRQGLKAHIINKQLCIAAQNHANYMAKTGDFSHYSNGGPSGRAARHGFHGMSAENIAMGQLNVGSVFQSWHSSSGHWANITSNATLAGFGYAISPGGTGFWVGMYGD